MRSKQLFLSLSDFTKVLKRGWQIILGSGLITGVFFSLFFLNQEINYSARGTFKGGASNSASTLTKALGIVGKDETSPSSDDPLVFLHSYPVIEEVVRSLNLQGQLQQKNKNRLSRMWKNLKIEFAFRSLKRQKIDSTILTKNALIPLSPLLSDQKETLHCHTIHYPLEVAKLLRIQFKDDRRFQVFDKRKKVCEGVLDQPVQWKGGSFILSKKDDYSVRKKRYYLTLIPLPIAVHSLMDTIKIKRDNQSSTLFSIEYRHPNRHLAAAIVNQTMHAFQKYLHDEGKRKTSKQLTYLHTRQNEVLEGLEGMMEEHKNYLQSHVDASDLLTLDKELEFIAVKQVEEKMELARLKWEIEQIEHSLEKNPLLYDLDSSTSLGITEENAKTLLNEYQRILDQLRLEKERYDYCLSKLKEERFDSASLAKIIADPILSARFEKIHTLHRNHADKKNWTSKEHDLFEEELLTEKLFLTSHINSLKEGVLIQEETLVRRILHLQHTHLHLLAARQQSILNSLDQLSLQATHFPQKWLAEEKIALNTTLHTEMMGGISKLIESKNIDHHVDFISSTPLMLACAPPLPEAPQLFMKFLVGIVIGLFLAMTALILREIYLGPSASLANLQSRGLEVCGLYSTPRNRETVRRVIKKLHSEDRVVCFSSQVVGSFPESFLSLLSKRQERVLLLDLRVATENGLLNYLSTKPSPALPIVSEKERDILYLGSPFVDKEELLGSQAFLELLEKLKREYDRILLLTRAHPHSTEIELLTTIAQKTIYGIAKERFHEIETLSNKTLFVIYPTFSQPRTLGEIKPLLEKMIRMALPRQR